MKKGTIFVEGLGVVEGHFSGIGQYILGMLRGMDELIDDAKRNGEPHPKIFVVIPYDTLPRFNSFGFRHIKPKRLPFNFRYMSNGWVRGVLPPIDLFCGRGHYIFTRFVRMPLAFSESSQIVYDLSFELHPQYGDGPNVKFLSQGTQQSVEKASNVFTISESVKNEIHEVYGVPLEKISVGYPAVDQRMFFKRPQTQVERVKDKYNIHGDYIIALSNLEPRKNLGALVEAYCSLEKEITDRVGLLIVGVTGWKTDELFNEIIDKVKQGYNIMRPSEYVSDEDKPALLSGAKMMVYPSHYEGFGIPPVEALACGTPVIAANNSSLPEAVGSVGKLVKKDSKTLAKEMIDTLNHWKDYSKATEKAGPEHAARFSFKDTARVFIDRAQGAEK